MPGGNHPTVSMAAPSWETRRPSLPIPDRRSTGTFSISTWVKSGTTTIHTLSAGPSPTTPSMCVVSAPQNRLSWRPSLLRYCCFRLKSKRPRNQIAGPKMRSLTRFVGISSSTATSRCTWHRAWLALCGRNRHSGLGLRRLSRSPRKLACRWIRGQTPCSPIDLDRCTLLGCGKWEEVPSDPQVPLVTFMHSALLPKTNKVLFWGYVRTDQSRLWDYTTPAGKYDFPQNQPGDVAPAPPNPPYCNLHSAGHAYLDNDEGTLLAHGGESQDEKQTLLFHPATLQWERKSPTDHGRFYATTHTLPDGKLLTLFGSLGPDSIEVYDPGTGTWSAPKALPASFDYRYYPWTYLLPGGELFIAGHQKTTRRFDWTANPIIDDPAKRWDTNAGDRSPGGSERGTSVLLPLRPPNYEPRILIAAGNSPAAQQTSEMIDLSEPMPSWKYLQNLNVARPDQCTSVLLPDGKV